MKWILLALIVSGHVSAAQLYGPYGAEVIRVVDGDTIEMKIAIWPGLTQKVKLRLAGVNAPEKHGKGVKQCEKNAAKIATAFTTEWLSRAIRLQVYDIRNGKYAGRVLGKIRSAAGDLGKALTSSGHATPYYGGKRQRWC